MFYKANGAHPQLKHKSKGMLTHCKPLSKISLVYDRQDSNSRFRQRTKSLEVFNPDLWA